MKLPENPLFSPAVEVKVFDHRVIYKPLIGATTIPIDALLPWAAKPDLEEIPDNAEPVVAPLVWLIVISPSF